MKSGSATATDFLIGVTPVTVNHLMHSFVHHRKESDLEAPRNKVTLDAHEHGLANKASMTLTVSEEGETILEIERADDMGLAKASDKITHMRDKNFDGAPKLNDTSKTLNNARVAKMG